MTETSDLPPILDAIPWTLEDREGRVCGVITADCRVLNDHGWLQTYRAGQYIGSYPDSDEATLEDEAIRNGDLGAAVRFALTVERDPIVIAADAAARAELEPAARAGERFMQNPGGRPPFAPEGVEPHQYRADAIARVLEEIRKRDGQRGAVIAALSTVHISTPLIDEAAARALAHKDQREFDLEDVLRKWWDRNKPS